MPIPFSERVVYEKNPLIEVICQLRFPAILKIDSEIPSAYQERIRDGYPIYSDSQNADLNIAFAPDLAKTIGNLGPLSFRAGRAGYDFISADGHWKTTLTRESLAISSISYKDWQDFYEHLQLPLRSFVEMYAPAFYTRIGLRYRNLIQRSPLQLDEVPWSELLNSHVAGELNSPDIAGDITHRLTQLVLTLDRTGHQVLINHGTVLNQQQEKCYLIDSDFSTDQKTETTNAEHVLDYFNKQSGKLFRWCITSRLHSAMGQI